MTYYSSVTTRTGDGSNEAVEFTFGLAFKMANGESNGFDSFFRRCFGYEGNGYEQLESTSSKIRFTISWRKLGSVTQAACLRQVSELENSGVSLDTFIPTKKPVSGGCCDIGSWRGFFWSLKRERRGLESSEKVSEVRISGFKYIQTYCNSGRLHKSLEIKSPDRFDWNQKTPLVAQLHFLDEPRQRQSRPIASGFVLNLRRIRKHATDGNSDHTRCSGPQNAINESVVSFNHSPLVF